MQPNLNKNLIKSIIRDDFKQVKHLVESEADINWFYDQDKVRQSILQHNLLI